MSVEGSSACVPWGGYVNKDGYGLAWNPRTKRMDCAHRVAYEREVGPIPEGRVLDHLCRFRACTNVRHLEPVPHAINCRRGAGTKLTEAQVEEIHASSETSFALAARFGVHDSTIRNVRRGYHYKEVAA